MRADNPWFRRLPSAVKVLAAIGFVAALSVTMVALFSGAIVRSTVAGQLHDPGALDNATVLTGSPADFLFADDYYAKFALSSSLAKSLLASSQVLADCSSQGRSCPSPTWHTVNLSLGNERPGSTVCARAYEADQTGGPWFNLRMVCISESTDTLWYYSFHHGW
jgi:hypothetical protein